MPPKVGSRRSMIVSLVLTIAVAFGSLASSGGSSGIPGMLGMPGLAAPPVSGAAVAASSFANGLSFLIQDMFGVRLSLISLV